MKLLIVLLPIFLIVGCKQQYRYPCQDFNNWNKPICQKPYCEVHRECPEHLLGENYGK
jgi:hypothetical protein